METTILLFTHSYYEHSTRTTQGAVGIALALSLDAIVYDAVQSGEASDEFFKDTHDLFGELSRLKTAICSIDSDVLFCLFSLF